MKFTVERSRIDPIERRSSDQRNESGEQQNEKETKGKRKDCFFFVLFLLVPAFGNSESGALQQRNSGRSTPRRNPLREKKN